MKILLIGLSHKTAPVEIREQHVFSKTMLRAALTHFDTNHKQAHLDHVKEGVILSTCNRLEIYALVDNSSVAQHAIINFLSNSCSVPAEQFTDYLYIYHDDEAVQHLLRVASGLDSMVLGEPQILGQIRDAFEAALLQQAAGTVLSALFRAAIHTGKRARTETAISVNPSSISSVTASAAEQMLGDLSRQQILLIGVGEMGAIAVRALLKRGVSKIVVANRTLENAERLAKVWGGQAITFQQLPAAIAQADIIITATGAPHTILDRALLEPVMKERPDRPLFVIDIAVPRDADPNIAEIPNVQLCDIDDLQYQAQESVRDRQTEIPAVEMIVAEETTQFVDWFASLEVTSTIAELRQQIDQVRQCELERLLKRLDLDERERNLIATMSHRLVNKILHQPTMYLKKEAANGNGAACIATARHLFHLKRDHQANNNS